MFFFASTICFIACHGGPADHFATFTEQLVREGYEVHVYASGPALKKFQDRQIPVDFSFEVDNLLANGQREVADQIANRCKDSTVVITDVGHPFDATVQRILALNAPKVMRLAYYDNPEPYVPGGYSKTASEVMKIADRVLFSNSKLAGSPIYVEPHKELDLPLEHRVGIGYYPTSQADKIAAKRAESHDQMRTRLLSKHGIVDSYQKLLVYFGGNNEAYFQQAFPAFLRFLAEGTRLANLSQFIVVLQQHPGARSSNRDRMLLEAWNREYGHLDSAPKVLVSDQSSDDMQIVADGALYYQTSMGPLFALAGIPTIQVGHEAYEDILVRTGLAPSVTNSKDLVIAIQAINPSCLSGLQRRTIFSSLGIREDWFSRLSSALVPPCMDSSLKSKMARN